MKTYKPTQILIAANKEESIGTVIAEALMNAGFNSTLVARSDNLLSELRGESYSVLILINNDLTPDEMIQLTIQIRHFHKNIKIIVLSGSTADEFPERVIKVGASKFFALPVNLEELTKCVHSIILEKG